MKDDTWRRLEQLAAEWPILFGGPVADSDVAAAAREIGVRFDDDYAAFVCRFGGAMVKADPIFGLRTADVMGVGQLVVDATRRFRNDKWPGIDDWYVISTDGGGSPVGVDQVGRVWLSDHGDVVELAPSFEAFVLHLLRER